jgi:hypothetical protein
MTSTARIATDGGFVRSVRSRRDPAHSALVATTKLRLVCHDPLMRQCEV